MDHHLSEFVRRRFGIALTPRHLKLVKRAVANRVRATGLNDTSDYMKALAQSPRETEVFRSLLLVHTTWFFREPVTLYTLKRRLLPGMLCDGGRSEFRVWCVGCATGEELYSLAMMALDMKTRWNLDMPVRLFGTDLDASVLATAEHGRYSRDQCRNLPLGYADRYCDTDHDHLLIHPELRKLARFSVHDAARNRSAPADSVYGDFDLVLCRNVLIYYEESTRVHLIRNISRHIGSGGALVLGLADPIPSEWPEHLVELAPGTRIFVRHTHLHSSRLS